MAASLNMSRSTHKQGLIWLLAVYFLSIVNLTFATAPTTSDFDQIIPEDQTLTIPFADFNATFNDADGNAFASVKIISLPSEGTLQIDAANALVDQFITVSDLQAGKLKFIPAPNANGDPYTTFQFSVVDELNEVSIPATITIHVTAENDPPTAQSNTIVGIEDTPLIIPDEDFSFSDVDGHAFDRIEIINTVLLGLLKNGTTTLNDGDFVSYADLNTGNLTFTPALNGNGEGYTLFTFRAYDETDQNSQIRTITIDVTSVNDIPTSAPVTIAIQEDGSKIFSSSDFTFIDADGQAMDNIRISSLNITGSLQLSSVDVIDNQIIDATDIPNLVFIPLPDGNGNNYATFNFEVSDGTAYSTSTYLFTINVTAVDDPPTINPIPDPADIYEDAGLQQIIIGGITAGGGEPALNISAISVSSSNTSLILNPTVSAYNSVTGEATINYTPLVDQYGQSTLTVTVDDGSNDVSDDFLVNVLPINDEPTINVIGNQSTDEDTQITIDINGISAGALNESGQFITITATSGSSSIVPNGIVAYTQGNDAGTITFTPVLNAIGTSIITVRVNDGVAPVYPGDDNEISFTFELEVVAVNDPPTLADIATPDVIEEDAGSQSIGLSGIGDGDPELMQTLTISAVSDNTALVETFTPNYTQGNSTATIGYTPKANAYGTANVEVTIYDGDLSIIKSFTITVDAVNDPPTIDAVGIVDAIDEDAPLQTIDLSGITPGPNETGQSVSVSATSDKPLIIPNPVAAYNSTTETWSITYTPAADQYGTVIITITVTDDDTNVKTATTTFTQVVNPVNDPPTLNALSNVNIDEDAGLQNVVFDGIADDGAVPKNLTVTATSSNTDIISNSNITVNYTSPNTGGSIDFEANPDRYGPVNITIRVTDKDGLFTEETLKVDITNINDPPTLNDIPTPSAALEDASEQAITLTGISPGPNESESLSASVSAIDATLFKNLSVTLNGDGTGTLAYTPDDNANGSTIVTVMLDDMLGSNSTIEKSVSLTVLAVNDIPTFDIPAIEAISENSGARSLTAFATNIDDGDPEVQSLSFTTIPGTPTSNLSFVSPPSIDAITGNLTYQSAANTNGQVTVNVTLLDNGGTANGGINQITKVFTLIVTAVNDPPTFTLNGDPPTINEDAGAIREYGFAQNISDGDPELSQDLEFEISQASGSLTFSSFPLIDAFSGDLTYAVSDNAYGTATFDVVLRETVSSLASSSAQFTITVDAVNDPPIGENGIITINEDETYAFQASDFSFSDIDNHIFEGIQVTVLPLNGTLLFDGSTVSVGAICQDISLLSYTPASNENGSGYATYNFKVRDESGDLSTDSYSMTINVDAISDDPTGASASVNTNEDTNYAFIVDNFPFSDSDNDAFNGIIIQTNVDKGALLENSVAVTTFPATIADVTKLEFQPPAGQSGTPFTNFTFDVVDGSNANSSNDSNSPYTMSINVGAVNDPPTGGDDNISMSEDQTYAFSSDDFTFSDPDGHNFAGIQITQIESTGSLKYNGIDVVALTNYPDITLLTYTPPSNQNGPNLANFKFRVIDSSSELNVSTSSYTMTINVTGVNDAPVFTITENPPAINEDAGAQTIPGFASSIDDGDVELTQVLNFGLSYSAPATLTFASPPDIDETSGDLTYTPNADTYGTVTIDVTLGDDGGTAGGGNNQSAVQQFTIKVNPINDIPTLDDITGTYTVNEDASTFPVNIAGISAGPNETQTITIETSTSNDLLVPAPSVVYTSPNTTAQLSISPVANANGSATITVTVRDGQTTNGSVSKTFLVTVNEVNDPPTLDPIASPAAINEDAGEQTINITGISAGPDEIQALSVAVSSDNQALIPNGSININYTSPNTIGSLTYQPQANQSGTAEITVTVTDDATTNNFIERKFNVEVLPVNDPPTLADLPTSPIVINEDAGVRSLTLSGITAGGGESQPLTISAVSDKPGIIPNPVVGSLSGGEAELNYQPATNQFGLVTITVTVNDGQTENNTVVKSFQVDVRSVNDIPTLNAITGSPFTINEDAPIQNISLTGISAGGGEIQTLSIYAESRDETIIENPTISYTQGNTSATLSYAPVANKSGSVIIDVYVNDLGSTNNIVTRSFTVNVNQVNDFPTINDIISPGDILEDASQQTVALSGISAGGGENQPVLVTAAEITGTDIISTITINYSGNNNASLFFALNPNANGATSIIVTVNDQQSENNITTKSFNINVLKVNDLPTLDLIPSPYNITEDAGMQTIGLTGISPGPNESEQSIVVTAISDNTSLIPNPSIVNKTATTKDLVFTPVNNKNGTAKITVTANDQQGSNNIIQREFTVNVAADNDAPTFDIIPTVSITENAGLQNINNFATNMNDGDPELTQTLSFNLDITGSLNFTIIPTISPANGLLTFETAENSNGQSIIDVTLSDNGSPPQVSSPKTFTINVLPVNGEPSFTLNGNPPASTEDAGLVTETNFAQNIDDGDPELDQSASLNFIVNVLSSDISYTISPNINPSTGDLTYQAAQNSFGTSFISVTLSDGNKSSAPSYFTLTINPVNDAPVGSDETVVTNEDVQYNFKSTDFTYSDLESNPFSGIQIITLENIGDLEYNGSDVFLNQQCPDVTRLVYKPLLNGNGNDYATFDFKLRDSEGKLSDTYTMTIDVISVDDNPTSANGEVSTDENISYQFVNTDFTFNDPDDGDTFNGIRIFSLETRGELNYNNKNVKVGDIITDYSLLIFTPIPDESGNPYATFEFEVRDSKNAFSTEYTMSIVVGPVNDRPTGSNESLTMLEDGVHTFSNSDFTFNDLDGHAFDGIRIETLESNGDLDYNGSDITDPQTLCPDVSLLTFQPNANGNGTGYATFTFKVKDNSASFNISEANYTMTINVTAVNDAPVFTISGNPPAINEDAGNQSINNFATSISSGDPEATQTLQFSTPNLISSTGNLAFLSGPTINSVGTLNYQASPNTFGSAIYSVLLTDNGGTSNGGDNSSDPQNFTISVNSINDPPTIGPIADRSPIEEDATEQSVNLTNITAGPLENQGLSVTAKSSNTSLIPTPTVQYSSPESTGTISYSPISNQSGEATITVTVSDGGSINSSIEETFLVTVNSLNDPPTINIVPDQDPILENAGEQIINLDGITAGGGEAQELLLTVTSSNITLIPTPSLSYLGGSTAQLAYKPVANTNGESTITVKVDDQNGGITNMAFKVTVSPVNDPPTLDPITDPIPISEDDIQQEIILTGVSAGNNEIQDLIFNINSSNPGLLNILPAEYIQNSSTAILKYTPAPDEFGSTIITVTIDDGSLLDNQVSKQFIVEVLPVPDTPVVTDASTDQNSQTTSGLIISRSENDGAEITYFKITNIQNGNLFLQDGITEIINGEYIPYEQANLGLRFTPNSNLDGSFDIQSSLEDADTGLGGGIITAKIFINSIPTTTFPFDNLSMDEDSPETTFNLYQYFDDEEDLDVDLLFEVNNTAPEIVNAQVTDQTLAINFLENQSGVVFITIKCTDTKGAFVEHELQLIVQPVNDSPVFKSEGITTGEQGVLYEYAIVTSDVEGNDREITLTTGPSWLWLEDIGDGTATLSGTPTNDDLGAHSVEIIVSESISGLSSSQIFTINVNNVNDTPRIVSVPVQYILVGQKYEYKVEVEDPDPGDSYTLTIDETTRPNWLILNSTTKVLVGFPDTDDIGNFNIKLIVWDEAGAASEQEFTITVSAPNTPPTIAGGYSETIDEDDILVFLADTFKVLTEDPDMSDTLAAIIITELPSYGILTINGNSVNLNDTIPVNEIQNLEYNPNNNFNGQDLIVWKAFDGKASSIDDGDVRITINPIDDPPQIIDMEANSVNYAFGDYNVNLSQSAEVIEVDDGRIISAIFSVIDNYDDAQDSLSIDEFDGIETNWNDTTGILTVAGVKSDDIYTQIVRSLIYINQKRFAPSILTRTIELKVFDGVYYSEPVVRNIEFEDSFIELVIPTGFTPNDSPPNDLWEIENIETHEDAIVRIYSRSGNRMYESIGPYKPWDGKYNGDYVKTGVYYYTIEIPKFERKYSGTITVLR